MQFLVTAVRPVGGWIKIGNSYEHAKWVTADEIEQTLGVHPWRDSVHTQPERKDLIRAIVRCSSPYVAITADSGEFESLVYRNQLLDKIGRKLA